MKTTVEMVDNKLERDDDEKWVFDLNYREEDENGYHDNNITVCLLDDGDIYLSDADPTSEDFIYLYAGQVELLKKLLRSKRGKRNGNQEGQESWWAQQRQDGVPQQQQNNAKAQSDARPTIQRARRSRGLC